eukprot:CAMPEP_0119344192 /NCGR_PEP_ID=MMETSP1333-20130426/106843_1 /TAXON_ID=418940 /ORGANISM="Scyphosphaera apsteinii, Strain RCC1455" /LENGTH=244 /DNA_ID=CAMNT_0007356619 /DNA_START=154 /DNA_END=888 /DNA_ORIENTATION=-
MAAAGGSDAEKEALQLALAASANSYYKEKEWVLDAVRGLFSSRRWLVPLDSFVDANCVIFAGGEGNVNTLEHKQIFQAFRELIDTTLQQVLTDLGISMADFAAMFDLVRSNAQGTQQQQVCEILAQVEDFGRFKAMMVKRNREVHLEVRLALMGRAGNEVAGNEVAGNEVAGNGVAGNGRVGSDASGEPALEPVVIERATAFEVRPSGALTELEEVTLPKTGPGTVFLGALAHARQNREGGGSE